MSIALIHAITRCHCLVWRASEWQQNDFIKQPQDGGDVLLLAAVQVHSAFIQV